ncbi:MAG: hypothetical protein SPM04_10495 [Lachnospira sp.]|nr:hypothetical protein [Lachnospira sp.]
MNRLDFDYPFDLADTITALLGDINDDYPVISVYGKYDVIKDILEDLIVSGVSIANEIELQDYDVAHYDKEFVLYLTKNGINAEKTYDVESDAYLSGSADISFIHEDCNSKLIKYVDSKTIYEFGYDEDDECDCDECDDCEECLTINGEPATKEEFDAYVSQFKNDKKPTTTSSAKSVYKVNGKECSKEEFDKKYEEFEEMYLDNISDMLLNYCEFMDSVNDWRSRMLRW